VASSRVFFDATNLIARTKRGGGFDGMKVDTQGHLWATGPGGVLIISPGGVHLGTILTGRATANCAFGGADGHSLYLAADHTLLRLRTLTTGAAR